MTNRNLLNIEVATEGSLEDLAIALAEGDHLLGADATAAGSMLTCWPGSDCPWFVAGPSHYGDLVSMSDARIVEVAP